MLMRLILGAGLVCLIAVGLGGGASAPAWGLTEVSPQYASELVGGAKCPSYAITICNGLGRTKNCPGSPCYVGGNSYSGNLSKQSYCGCSKSCSTKQYYQGSYPCATTTSTIVVTQ